MAVKRPGTEYNTEMQLIVNALNPGNPINRIQDMLDMFIRQGRYPAKMLFNGLNAEQVDDFTHY
ncbi:MAG TPA: hypothetical protein V6C97_17240 [Oculatellaceae cyanobacterium]